MDVLSEYITETIIGYCTQKNISKDFNYEIKTTNNQNSIVINACVYSHPYHDSTISILEIDCNNKILKLQRANGIVFKEPLNDIGVEDHLTMIESWSDNKGNILIPFNMVESMLPSQNSMKKAIKTIVSNILGYAYCKQIVEKTRELLNPVYLEHANLKANFNSGNIHSAIITLENNPWRNGVVKGNSFFANIKSSGKTTYINFKESFSYQFCKLGIECTANKTEQKAEFIRISLPVFMEHLYNPSEDFIKLINKIFLRNISFPEFGCCSKYAECEKAGKCLHVDQLYATACQYQKLLKRTGKFEST